MTKQELYNQLNECNRVGSFGSPRYLPTPARFAKTLLLNGVESLEPCLGWSCSKVNDIDYIQITDSWICRPYIEGTDGTNLFYSILGYYKILASGGCANDKRGGYMQACIHETKHLFHGTNQEIFMLKVYTYFNTMQKASKSHNL